MTIIKVNKIVATIFFEFTENENLFSFYPEKTKRLILFLPKKKQDLFCFDLENIYIFSSSIL